MHGIHLFESSEVSGSLNAETHSTLFRNYGIFASNCVPVIGENIGSFVVKINDTIPIYQEIRNHERFGEFYNSALESLTLNCTADLKYEGSKHEGRRI
ncbi:hypothetical protein T01_11646 [Trichinella spiralis]|uniref:Uncharacterized protein n=1 Tax=Trichinella spiralis TaxID=6334 RepID=A0A0V1B6S3_TRISP|nr:hypothetical protein T01_11646 [Trichinella spiralis]